MFSDFSRLNAIAIRNQEIVTRQCRRYRPVHTIALFHWNVLEIYISKRIITYRLF